MAWLQFLNIPHILQLAKLLFDLLQDILISIGNHCHSGITLICSYTNCKAVDVIAAPAEQPRHTAQYAGCVVYQQ